MGIGSEVGLLHVKREIKVREMPFEDLRPASPMFFEAHVEMDREEGEPDRGLGEPVFQEPEGEETVGSPGDRDENPVPVGEQAVAVNGLADEAVNFFIEIPHVRRSDFFRIFALSVGSLDHLPKVPWGDDGHESWWPWFTGPRGPVSQVGPPRFIPERPQRARAARITIHIRRFLFMATGG